MDTTREWSTLAKVGERSEAYASRENSHRGQTVAEVGHSSDVQHSKGELVPRTVDNVVLVDLYVVRECITCNIYTHLSCIHHLFERPKAQDKVSHTVGRKTQQRELRMAHKLSRRHAHFHCLESQGQGFVNEKETTAEPRL